MTVFSAYITNLGKYNEGSLVGKWHDFPTTKEAIRETFAEIGIDGIRYEEFFITDYDCDIDGIHSHLGEYSSINELNYLAEKIEGLEEWEAEVYRAAVESGDYCGSVKDLINLTDNLGCFDFTQGLNDDYNLGYYWAEESGCYDTKNMGSLTNYIDYERFGRDIRLDEGGVFTSKGYIRNNGDSFNEEYDGIHTPDEHRVFALPKPEPVKQAIQKSKARIDRGAR